MTRKLPDLSASRSVIPRTESHIRFKPPARRIDTPALGSTPSTLPPPPFQSEAEVTGNEWWLESHMTLAANILCLEQMLDAVPRLPATIAPLDRVRATLGDVSLVRDALYEVYCDAADERMRPWTADGTPLAVYIKGLYAWCDGIVEAYVGFAAGLRKQQPGYAVLHDALERLSPLCDEAQGRKIIDALRTLGIDAASPIEPLRNVYKDLEEMVSLARSLRAKVAPVTA